MICRSRLVVAGSAAIASALGWAAPTATAAEQHGRSADVGNASVISTANREAAIVPVLVRCDPIEDQVVVPATGATRWRQAGATVRLTGQADGYAAPQQVCHSVMNPDGSTTVICETWTPQLHLFVAADPMPIQLVTPH
jgi:hypothetical protein